MVGLACCLAAVVLLLAAALASLKRYQQDLQRSSLQEIRSRIMGGNEVGGADFYQNPSFRYPYPLPWDDNNPSSGDITGGKGGGGNIRIFRALSVSVTSHSLFRLCICQLWNVTLLSSYVDRFVNSGIRGIILGIFCGDKYAKPGCIFAEVLTGRSLFPGKNVVHQLDLNTDLLGTPSMDTISRVRNEKARRYLTSMRKKQPVPFSQKFPNADPLARRLLERLLAFDPKDRPTAEEALADPYFKGLAKVEREPSCQPITKMEFEFERRRVTKEDVRELIFREILEYHPQLLKDYMNGIERTNFLYPSAVNQFRKQFAHLEENIGKSGPVIPLERKHVSLPRSTIVQANVFTFRDWQIVEQSCNKNFRDSDGVSRASQAPQRISLAKPGKVVGPYENGNVLNGTCDPRTVIGNSVIPSQAGPPAYSYRRSGSGKLGRSTTETEMRSKQVPQSGIGAKLAPDIAINIDNNPFYMMRVGVANGGISAGAATAAATSAANSAAHRKVGTV
ncbi:Mitogen-activated protein kinase 20 [Camellia lanceoleosa]|uniref:Mitogen-activated protein kinase 20 n=1 Tax=Camellia lanceoleosa TaxID=1840588 RepID=A0ACC0IK46_9ERIC|nr:Mitogen-activated protein kinase 20 [Camellia lanceoleosa]